jgi:hypothetical protein
MALQVNRRTARISLTSAITRKILELRLIGFFLQLAMEKALVMVLGELLKGWQPKQACRDVQKTS